MEATSAVGISDAILFASHESLASALALIEELSLLRLIWSKGSELVEKTSNVFSHGTWIADSDHFHDVLTAKAKQFDSTSPGELLLRTLGSLQKLVEASPRDLRVSLDLSEVAEDICTCTVRILRENTKGEKEDKKFAGSTTTDMVKFEMTRIFGGLNIRLEELSTSQQQSLVDAIRKFLEGLPPDQQRFILEKLGASEISEAAIRQAIASGTMWAAFAAAVQVFGFSFYMIAAQLLAIVSLHLLPFGAYMALSSTIAVLSSAWMLPIFAGFGIWYYSRSNQNLRKSMVPLIVTSLCLSGMEVQARNPGRLDIVGTEVLDLWRNAREDRDEKRRRTQKGGYIKNEAESRLQRVQAELKAARNLKDRATRERDALNRQFKEKVDQAMDRIASGNWGAVFSDQATKVCRAKDRVEEARQKRGKTKGWWTTIVGYVDWFFETQKLEETVKAELDVLSNQLKTSRPTDRGSYPPNITSMLESTARQVSEIMSAEKQISQLSEQESVASRDLKRASEELVVLENARKRAEEAYFGLSRV